MNSPSWRTDGIEAMHNAGLSTPENKKEGLIIKRFDLDFGDNTLLIQTYGRVLSVTPSPYSLQLYVLVAQHMPMEERNFLVVGTNSEIKMDEVPAIQAGHPSLLARYQLSFIGSAPIGDGWGAPMAHVFERLKGQHYAR